MIAAKQRKLTHKYCPHCKKDCNIKTYKDHKRLFFNSDTKSWYCEGAVASEESDGECDLQASISSDEEPERELSPPLLFSEDVAEKSSDRG